MLSCIIMRESFFTRKAIKCRWFLAGICGWQIMTHLSNGIIEEETRDAHAAMWGSSSTKDKGGWYSTKYYERFTLQK